MLQLFTNPAFPLFLSYASRPEDPGTAAIYGICTALIFGLIGTVFHAIKRALGKAVTKSPSYNQKISKEQELHTRSAGMMAENERIRLMNKGEKAKPYFGSELGIGRYDTEHNFLRSKFFHENLALLSELQTAKNTYNGAHWFYNKYLALSPTLIEAGIGNPYRPEDFIIKTITFPNDINIFLLILPIPEYIPLCYRIYFVTSFLEDKKAYYTIERGEEQGFLCAWQNENHINIHPIIDPETIDINAEAAEIASLFQNNVGV